MVWLSARSGSPLYRVLHPHRSSLLHWPWKVIFRPYTKANFFLGYVINSVKTAFLMPLDKKITFASLSIYLATKQYLWSLGRNLLERSIPSHLSSLLPGYFLVCPASQCQRHPRAIPVSPDLKAELKHWRFLDSWSGFLHGKMRNISS